MKPVRYGLINFFTGVYIAVGGYSLVLYYYSVLLKLSRRDRLMEELEYIPYPYISVIGMYVMLAIYVFIGIYLMFLAYKQKVIVPHLLIKLGLCIVMILSGFYSGKEGIEYWDLNYPMNKERAINRVMEIKQNESILRAAYWDKGAWYITVSDDKAIYCETFVISRGGLSYSTGHCD